MSEPTLETLAPAPLSAMLYAALSFADRGWAVFPCRERGKEPLTRHGCNAASTDRMQVRTWWDACPRANIGLHAGRSGLVVVDADTPEAVAWLEAQPATLMAATGRGRHAYYLAPEGVELAPTAGTIRVGIDTRAGNSYVLAPPSVHPSGALYAWFNCSKLAPLPDGLTRGALLTRSRAGGLHQARARPAPQSSPRAPAARTRPSRRRQRRRLCNRLRRHRARLH